MVIPGAQNTYTTSGYRTRKIRGFFASMVLANSHLWDNARPWPGVRLIQYPQGEYARRLVAVLSTRPPSQKGRNQKCY